MYTERKIYEDREKKGYWREFSRVYEPDAKHSGDGSKIVATSREICRYIHEEDPEGSPLYFEDTLFNYGLRGKSVSTSEKDKFHSILKSSSIDIYVYFISMDIYVSRKAGLFQTCENPSVFPSTF